MTSKEEELKAAMEDLREKLKHKKRDLNLVDSPIKPRYDDVYFDGIKWLNSL